MGSIWNYLPHPHIGSDQRLGKDLVYTGWTRDRQNFYCSSPPQTYFREYQPHNYPTIQKLYLFLFSQDNYEKFHAPLLQKAGWDIQNTKTANIYSSKGVAVEFFNIKAVGNERYLLNTLLFLGIPCFRSNLQLVQRYHRFLHGNYSFWRLKRGITYYSLLVIDFNIYVFSNFIKFFSG